MDSILLSLIPSSPEIPGREMDCRKAGETMTQAEATYTAEHYFDLLHQRGLKVKVSIPYKAISCNPATDSLDEKETTRRQNRWVPVFI